VDLRAARSSQAPGRPAWRAQRRVSSPNILVVMTDDQAAADVATMPHVRRLLAARGTTFADAVDWFPLCRPSRATFITGQYAHNHGVLGSCATPRPR
jgi:N-acetylglucosamine-6-sulfatase